MDVRGMRVAASCLTFEVTRRCNLQCEHCLRGGCEKVDMTKQVVDKVLENIQYIGCLVFTGGEPTLALPMIEYIFNQIHQRGISISSFWMATNGVANQNELMNILVREYYQVDEASMNGVAISTDMFHDANTEQNPLRLLSFYDNGKEHKGFSQDWVIKKGNAAENCIGSSSYKPSDEFYLEGDLEDFSIEQLYISANGNIVPSCDLTFSEIDDCHWGTVNNLLNNVLNNSNFKNLIPQFVA